MPTSITIAPAFTCSAPMRCGMPAAAMTMSAVRVTVARSLVLECVTVTVAFC